MKSVDVLVVDDEPTIRLLMKRTLELQGFSVRIEETGEKALLAIQDRMPDLAILDYNLPGLSGKEVCQRIRRNPDTRSLPVIIVTGFSLENLPIECLDSGADDYITKPFDVKEMIARVHAVLRRPSELMDENAVLKKGVIVIHTAERLVTANGKPLRRLTPKEFDLLHQIVLYCPRVLDKNILALKVWGQTNELLHGRTLDVHIRRIRSKLGPAVSKHLVTIPSIGYQWLDATASGVLASVPKAA